MKESSRFFWGCVFLCFFCFSFFGWHQIYYQTQSLDFASLEEEQVIKKIDEANKSISKISAPDDMTCSCSLGDQQNTIGFEDPKKCGDDRNYFAEKLAAFKKYDNQGLYWAPRDYSKYSQVLPRKCVIYIMRKFWKDRALSPAEKREADLEWNRKVPPDQQRTIKDVSEYKPDPRIYSKCDGGSDGIPERYGNKPCVTEDYVNLVYNSLIDVADCLDVPAKFIAPKLSNESGLHVNAFGMVNDGGIGQFTNQALIDVAENYDVYKAKILGSPKESCQRIKAMAGAVPATSKDILSADSARCHVISTPPNPLRSLVYYGIFYHATKRNAEAAFNRVGDEKNPNFTSVETLLKNAGIEDYNKNALKQMLFVMSYNSGPGRPVVYFKEWLKYRIQNLQTYPIKKADFDMNYWPEREHQKEKVGEDRAKAISKNGRPLSLPEYLFAYSNSVYIPAVKAQARMLDKGMGEGTCTEQKFLEL